MLPTGVRSFTPAEVAQLERRAENRVIRDAQASDPNRPPPEAGITIVSYNQVYFERGDRVAVVTGEPRSSLLTNPPNGRRPPLTPEAQRRQRERREFRNQFGAADHPELRLLRERCLTFFTNVGPPMLPNYAYNNNYMIVQTADYVMIHAEVVHDTRIIRLGEPDPLPDHVRPWMGDSWGRWEGDVLVVEMTNIYPLHTVKGSLRKASPNRGEQSSQPGPTTQRHLTRFSARAARGILQHVGEVMTAEIGHLRKGLIFNGDVLNTGARVQGECARLGRRLVSSTDLFERLDLPDEWTTEAMGPATLRGKSEPTELVAFA